MFDNRCMYYLTIVVVMLFSVSFIKLNKFWELDVRYGEVESDESMGTTIFKGVRFLIGIVLILMPGIMNPVYQSTEGMIVECVKADPVWRVDADDGVWHVTVEDTETGTKKIFYRCNTFELVSCICTGALLDYHERKTKTRRAKNRYILLLSGYIRAGIICINGHIRVETARVRKAMV